VALPIISHACQLPRLKQLPALLQHAVTSPSPPPPFPSLPTCPRSSEQDVKHAHREIMNHQRLLHPHVVQLKEVFAAKPYLALVMEFVPNGDMFQVLGLGGGMDALLLVSGWSCHV
jgi:serine/threonine protein kinase